MKSAFTFFAAGLALVLTSATARAEFEMWKNKEGKAAELEIAEVEEGAGGTQVHFRTKAGKEVTLKLDDLAAADQDRVKDWKKKPPLAATFAYVKNRPDGKVPRLSFVFDLKGEIALPFDQVTVTNLKAMVGGKDLQVGEWDIYVEDGSSSANPFGDPPPGNVRKWSIVVTTEGDFRSVAAEECEFSADVEVPCGKSPKEVSALMPLPGKNQLPSEEKLMDPFLVRLDPTFWPIPGKPQKNGGSLDEITGYYVWANSKSDDPGAPDWRWVFEKSIVARGKEYPNCIYKDIATNPVRVVVKYWSESYNVPLRLTKAASNKGRTPPKEEEVREGGADPFGG